MENKNLTKIALMQGLNEQEISLILNCLQAKIKKYEKGETIFQEGEKIEEIGIIFSGTVTVQRNDLVRPLPALTKPRMCRSSRRNQAKSCFCR